MIPFPGITQTHFNPENLQIPLSKEKEKINVTKHLTGPLCSHGHQQ